MKVALTYDLQSQYRDIGYSEDEIDCFDIDETVDAVESAITELGHDAARVGNVYDLVGKLASSGERWDLVFNMAIGLHGRNRELQVPAILESHNIHYTFSDPHSLSLTTDKAVAKALVRNAGLATSDFIVVRSPDDLDAAAWQERFDVAFPKNPFILFKRKGGSEDEHPYPLFVKPLAERRGKGVSARSVVRNEIDLKRQIMNVCFTCNQPVIVERYLPGRELSVGIFGTAGSARVAGVVESVLDGASVGKDFVKVKDKETVARASSAALEAWKTLECRDAGVVELREDASGRLQFMEINAIPCFHPANGALPNICRMNKTGYAGFVSAVIEAAVERNAVKKTASPFSFKSGPAEETKLQRTGWRSLR